MAGNETHSDVAHAHDSGEEPRQARFLGIMALVLLAFLGVGALIGIFQAIF